MGKDAEKHQPGGFQGGVPPAPPESTRGGGRNDEGRKKAVRGCAVYQMRIAGQ